MKLWNGVRKSMLVFGMALFLGMAAFPATDVCAAVQQTQVQAESQAAVVTAEAAEDDGFVLLIMGGGLLIILFAVVVSVATMSSVFGLASVMSDEEE